MSNLPHCYLTAICNANRTEAISYIEERIQKHGTLLDFNLFSDLSLALVMEIPGEQISVLIQELKTMLQFDKNPEISQNNLYQLYLNITFTQGKGELRHSIPEVPG